MCKGNGGGVTTGAPEWAVKYYFPVFLFSVRELLGYFSSKGAPV
jgi:hypothetical protein